MPVASQEQVLLQELLYCLLGCGGRHLTPCRGPQGRGVTFQLEPSIDPSLRSLLARVLPLASHYSQVSRYLSHLSYYLPRWWSGASKGAARVW